MEKAKFSILILRGYDESEAASFNYSNTESCWKKLSGAFYMYSDELENVTFAIRDNTNYHILSNNKHVYMYAEEDAELGFLKDWFESLPQITHAHSLTYGTDLVARAQYLETFIAENIKAVKGEQRKALKAELKRVEEARGEYASALNELEVAKAHLQSFLNV